MKRILPNRGFTLVELLVVISIISIMATIGATIYSGTQKNARDAKRKGDIEAITQVLEVNKQDTGYQALAATQFASGSVPTAGPKNDPYCINVAGAAPLTTPTTIWVNCPGNWSPLTTTNTPAPNTAQFIVCTSLEGGVPFCRSSAQ